MQKEGMVIDSSTILAYILPDENLPKDLEDLFGLYERNKLDLYAPSLLELEVANALRSSFLTKRVEEDRLLHIFSTFQQLSIHYENPKIEEALKNSLKYKLSIYDSLYLTLAKEKKIPLISLDKHLKSIS